MPTIAEVAFEDLPFLEILADIDSISESSTVPDDSSFHDFDLASDDKDIFDPFQGDFGAPLNAGGPAVLPQKSPVQSLVEPAAPGCSFRGSHLAIRAKRQDGFDQSPQGHHSLAKMRAADEASSTESPRRLKRAASALEIRSSQEDVKPAKLNKSFSEGLSEALDLSVSKTRPFSSVEQDVLPDAPVLKSSQLSAELDIEKDLNSIRYKIPLRVLIEQQKKNTRKSHPAAHWSHLLYQDEQRNRVKVTYCKTRAESESAAASMLHEPILGFDMEWLSSPSQSPNLTGLKRDVCVIQLACESHIVIFHISLHSGSTVQDLIAPSLREILESDRIIKTGVCVAKSDGKRLDRCFQIRCRSLLELSRLHQVLTNANRGPGHVRNCYHSLANLVEKYLELPLYKGDTRTGDWGRPLDEHQILYAAADAYAGYMLFRVMEIKRLNLSPIPPRPLFEEDGVPLSLQIESWYDARMASELAKREAPAEESPTAKVKREEESPSLRDGAGPHKEPVLDAKEEQLFRALCAHRLASSRQRKINAGFVASDNVLRIMAVRRPTDMAALQALPGIGSHRATQYGQAWLQIIQEHDFLWTPQPARLPGNLAQQEAATHRRLLSALQGLRSGLRPSRDAAAALPDDDVLDRLARVKPMTEHALSCVPGASTFNSLASLNGVDLLHFIKEAARTISSDTGGAGGGGGGSKKIIITYDPGSESGDSDCFEVMEVSRNIRQRVKRSM